MWCTYFLLILDCLFSVEESLPQSSLGETLPGFDYNQLNQDFPTQFTQPLLNQPYSGVGPSLREFSGRDLRSGGNSSLPAHSNFSAPFNNPYSSDPSDDNDNNTDYEYPFRFNATGNFFGGVEKFLTEGEASLTRDESLLQPPFHTSNTSTSVSSTAASTKLLDREYVETTSFTIRGKSYLACHLLKCGLKKNKQNFSFSAQRY